MAGPVNRLLPRLGPVAMMVVDMSFWSETNVADEPIKGPASYFPSIEKKYGRPVAEWQELVRKHLPAKHMELVAMLKNEHGMGHGHANALVAHTLAAEK